MKATEKIIVAAAYLEDRGQSPFSSEDLIVEAWNRFMDSFGLAGHETSFPDSNKIITSIVGKRGLVARGYLDKKGAKLYAMTYEGKRIAARLRQEPEPEPTRQRVKLSRDADTSLRRLFALETAGVESFALACKFWGISGDKDTKDGLAKYLLFFEDRLKSLATDIGDCFAVLSDGHEIVRADVAGLHELHRALLSRYRRHLDLLHCREKKVAAI